MIRIQSSPALSGFSYGCSETGNAVSSDLLSLLGQRVENGLFQPYFEDADLTLRAWNEYPFRWNSCRMTLKLTRSEHAISPFLRENCHSETRVADQNGNLVSNHESLVSGWL
jgi:hypothetical protein